MPFKRQHNHVDDAAEGFWMMPFYGNSCTPTIQGYVHWFSEVLEHADWNGLDLEEAG